MTAAAGGYLAMVSILADSRRDKMWPSWWLAVPVGLFAVAFLLMVIPVLRKRPPPDPTAPVEPVIQIPPPAPPRIGIRMRGGAGKFPNARIRNMDTSVDTENTDLEMPDPDIS